MTNIALEKFRSTYTGEPPPVFNTGVKQLVFERDDKGPAKIDRCISCHVALELPHFSPTKIAHDINGNIVRSVDGTPVQVPNENYVWGKLDAKIAALKEDKINLKEAAQLESLKTAQVGDYDYNVVKVLSMHPLIGKETRPFEFHPIEEYGCTTCHSGNGNALTTDKAHGPVFDKQYETEFMGYKPEFTERDPANEPQFARVFNDKPGDALLFQTTPILVGKLIQARCVQCHEQSSAALKGLADTAYSLTNVRAKKALAIQVGYTNEKQALASLLALQKLIKEQGYDKALKTLKEMENDPTRLAKEREYLANQVSTMERVSGADAAARQAGMVKTINGELVSMLGSSSLVEALEKQMSASKAPGAEIDGFLSVQQANPEATGTLFEKWKAANFDRSLLRHIEDTQQSLAKAASDESTITALETDVDYLTKNFHRGQELYISQACYACHRIAGTARGGVGPDLTLAGNLYPWYLKESIVWPQADLPTSTMPNYKLDSIEVQDLMTFLFAQKGPTKNVSDTQYKIALQEWEAGRKLPWEMPVPPSKIHDLRYSMTVFATQGCAACHRLEGFESNVGYAIEKDKKTDFDALYNEHEWFKALFPEEVLGSTMVKTLEKHSDEIDKHIVDGVRQGSILEDIEKLIPDAVESLYSNFRFASRAKNSDFAKMEKEAKTAEEKQKAVDRLKEWQARVHRVLMMYVQEYGLGRLVGPRPNWSGIYRSDEWLMEHFHNPSAHVPKSIMPVFPFDDSKFYALTYMLDVLGKRNRDAVRAVWDHKGFSPDKAFAIHCSQCHGPYLQGNGPVATWIYPIPKNLTNSVFLRSLTRDNAIQSITHGVKGTPMPPWGETPSPKPDYDGIPVLNTDEIHTLVDWLYSSLPGESVNKSLQGVPKWKYLPKDVIEELKNEGTQLKSGKEYETPEQSFVPPKSGDNLGFHQSLKYPQEIYYAAAEPKVNVTKLPVSDDGINKVFDVVPNQIPGGDKYAYYIKKEYYTKDNIEKGEQFFELNYSVCHGADADGTGIRASIMNDAKPRMLTNLDWLKSRDDLRLLRSIKYGVPGTAMTPWGDLTSSLQRLQLVMFIRSLSEEKDKREELLASLYAAFDTAVQQIVKVRIEEYPKIDTLQTEYDQVQKSRAEEYQSAQDSGKPLDSTLSLYKRQIELGNQLEQLKSTDKILDDLKELVLKQRELYQAIGNDMISAGVEEADWKLFIQIVNLNKGRFAFVDGKLQINSQEDAQKQIQKLADEIAAIFDKKITELPSEKNPKAAAFTKLKGRLLSGVVEDASLKRQEGKLLNHFYKTAD